MSAHPQTTSLPEPVPHFDLAAQYAAIGAEIRTAVERVLASQQFILGREGAAFEQEIAQLCGVAHGVGVASGTDALILALRACGVQSGDEVLIPAVHVCRHGQRRKRAWRQASLCRHSPRHLQPRSFRSRAPCYAADSRDYCRASLRTCVRYGPDFEFCANAQSACNRR